MSEIWLPIKNYKGLYEVSNLGKVRSCDKKVRCKNNKLRFIKGNLKKLSFDRDGYAFVDLYKHNKRKVFKVHRLVALAFISNPEKLPLVNHKDCNPSNNNVSNLEWCDWVYNNAYKNAPLKRKLSREINGICNNRLIKLYKGNKFISESNTKGNLCKKLKISLYLFNKLLKNKVYEIKTIYYKKWV